jgi:predicted phosphoribosyltransferase
LNIKGEGEASVPFRDRHEAGIALASALKGLKGRNVVVLAIPRGGVVVGREVAKSLGPPLDVIVTRKIGAPGEPEFALGAVTQNGEVILDDAAVNMLQVGRSYLDKEAANQRQEVRDRMSRFRGDRPFPSLKGKTVVIVDDGIATGNTILAAVKSARRERTESVVVAAPVGPAESIAKLSKEADRVVCLETPEPFFAIGQFYSEFEQVEDDEVRRILEANWAQWTTPSE